jgi:hypothetical protein
MRALAVAAFGLALSARAQDLPAPEPAPAPVPTPGFRLGVEVKVGFRDSKDLSTPIFTPYGPSRPGPLFQRTADPGTSLELDTINVRVEGNLAKDLVAAAEVHFLDLYSRNPTSSGDRVALREAWVRAGATDGLYVLAGLAPRFSKPTTRRLESYGMWGTAVGRYEEPQVEAGISLGSHAFAKAMVGVGNPLFLRDTNALAGDNGTPDRIPGSPERVYETGLPILYDARATDVSTSRLEWGAGAGLRFGRPGSASVELLGWYFARDLAPTAHLHGSALPAELELLAGEGHPLPFHGNHRREWGVNLTARVAGLRVFAQWVDQDLAGLGRRGYEAEVAWVQPLDGLLLVGETPVLTWEQPALRVSYADLLFSGPREDPSLSVLWDWLKIDVGVRVGIVRGVDLTVEYSRHDAETPRATIHPDELLAVLRFSI